MDLFGDAAVILNSIVSNSYYGMLGGGGKLVCNCICLWSFCQKHCNYNHLNDTNDCFTVFFFPGRRQGLCPVLRPFPMCAGNITGCDADERCSLGNRCCLQSDCTRKCVEAEIPPPESEFLTRRVI